jgi:hypothetical protein
MATRPPRFASGRLTKTGTLVPTAAGGYSCDRSRATARRRRRQPAVRAARRPPAADHGREPARQPRRPARPPPARRTPAPLRLEPRPMTPDWLHDNAHRLTQPAGMAVLGYGLTALRRSARTHPAANTCCPGWPPSAVATRFRATASPPSTNPARSSASPLSSTRSPPRMPSVFRCGARPPLAEMIRRKHRPWRGPVRAMWCGWVVSGVRVVRWVGVRGGGAGWRGRG